jgi:hypothetical protein
VADKPSTDRLRTALVVLAMPPTGPGGYTANNRPAPPSGAKAVQQWFSAKGFQVDSVVGIAFSISAPGTLFTSTFGAIGDTVELDQAALAGRLDPALLPYVAAVVIGPPPDFGPSR